VLLPHISDFDAMNAVYDAWIDPANPPARACYEARLADPDLRVEMTAIASL
jgi:enamine deaminase RidA (YjgF/YER057c/UK114 family)